MRYCYDITIAPWNGCELEAITLTKRGNHFSLSEFDSGGGVKWGEGRGEVPRSTIFLQYRFMAAEQFKKELVTSHEPGAPTTVSASFKRLCQRVPMAIGMLGAPAARFMVPIYVFTRHAIACNRALWLATPG